MAVGDINSNARGSGARYNDGKPPVELIPLRLIAQYHQPCARDSDEVTAAKWALLHLGAWQETGATAHLWEAIRELDSILDIWAECARVFDYGKRKYAAWNWAKGMAWSIPTACAARHLLKVIRGESADDESGLHHFGHVACNVVMLLTFARTFPEGNDLPTILTPEGLKNAA